MSLIMLEINSGCTMFPIRAAQRFSQLRGGGGEVIVGVHSECAEGRRWAKVNDFLMRQCRPQLLRNGLRCPSISPLERLRKAGVFPKARFTKRSFSTVRDIGAISSS